MIIDILQPQGPIFIPTLRHPNNDKIYVGWAMCELIPLDASVDRVEIKVWDIHVRPQYRRQGFATTIIEELQKEKESVIWTNYENISDDGAKTFLSCGFKSVKALKKYDANKLIWKWGEK